MASMIQLSAIVAASSSDVLNGTRLQSAPRNGIMTFEFQSQFADATNFYTVSLALPDGSTPLDGVLVPGTNPALAGMLDDRTSAKFRFSVAQGGHVTLSFTEAGTAVMIYRITFKSKLSLAGY